MVGFIAVALYGGIITGRVAESVSKDGCVRSMIAFAYMFMLVPIFATHFAVAGFLWIWLWLAVEFALVSALIVFFPGTKWMMATKTDAVGKLLFFGFVMPLNGPISYLPNLMGVKVDQSDAIGNVFNFNSGNGSFLWHGVQTLVVCALSLYKVVILQLVFNSAQFLYWGVSYFDAPLLNFAARHWHCSACMMELSANQGLQLTHDMTNHSLQVMHEMWFQFASDF